MEALKTRLRQLKLAGIVKTVESRNRYALEKKASYIDFLELLIEDEYVNRQANSFNKRLNRSKLNTQKDIDSFDFNYQPELDKTQLLDIAACRFITQNRNLVFMGKPGVGKTHLANAIGLEAIKKGYKVLFLHVNELIEKINSAKADGSRHQIMNELIHTDLVILDELGFKKIPSESIDDLFEVIRKRYENGSIIITTNRSFEGGRQGTGAISLATTPWHQQ